MELLQSFTNACFKKIKIKKRSISGWKDCKKKKSQSHLILCFIMVSFDFIKKKMRSTFICAT